MEPVASLSQGCFAYKRKPPKGKLKIASPRHKKQPKIKDTPASSNLSERLELFKDMWHDIHKQLKAHQSRIFADVLNELTSFLTVNSHNVSDGACEAEIPTAVFVAGANMPDHREVFAALERTIVSSLSPHVVSLTAKECPNIKSVIKRVANHLMDNSSVGSSDISLTKVTMSVLSAWYKNLYFKKKQVTPSKRRQVEAKKPKTIYIILENLESFDANVVENFVMLISEYSTRLPVVLVLGVATTPSVVHQIIPQTASSRLAMRTFRSASPDIYMDHILAKLLKLAEVFPLKLGSRLFQLLENNFLLDNLSSEAFVMALEVCLMEHMYAKSWSVLCCRQTDMSQRCQSLDHATLEDIRRLSSFRSYVQERSPKEQRQLLLDDQHLRDTVASLLQDIYDYEGIFYPMLTLLRSLSFNMLKNPFGIRLRELYSVCLRGEVADTETFADFMQALRLLDRDCLLTKVKSARTMISASCDSLPPELASVDDTLCDFVTRLTQLGEEAEAEAAAAKQFGPSLNLAPVMDRQKLMQMLKEKAKVTRSKSPFVVLREEVAVFLESSIRKYLRNYRNLALHEILYCDAYDSVKQQLLGNARGSVLMALSNPHHYLKCECCELTDVDEILPSLPKISIMYKLHLECGRMINICDWLEAYLLILEASKRGKTNKSQEEHQRQRSVTTFAQAVSELQHLGFVKPTQRKTDHVARLTW